MSDRVAVFDRGIVQQLDTVDRLYESPCNEFVANFIGDSNRLRGTIARRRRILRIPARRRHEARRPSHRRCDRGCAGRRVHPPRTHEPRRARGHANGAAANQLSGKARSLIYFGDHVRMRCALPGQDECFVKVPLGTGALDAFSPGAPVALAFSPEHLRVFA